MSNWQQATLGEVCELYQPQTITTKDLVQDGRYLVYGANGVIGRYDKFNHAESQLLITCRGATCGSVNVSSPNDAVEKPDSEHLFQLWVDFFQTKPWFSFLASCFF